MIAPEFRLTENLNVLKPAADFISFNYGKSSLVLTWNSGDNMWKSLEHDINSVQQLHNNLVPASGHKNDSNQLAKYKDMFIQ